MDEPDTPSCHSSGPPGQKHIGKQRTINPNNKEVEKDVEITQGNNVWQIKNNPSTKKYKNENQKKKKKKKWKWNK